MAGKIVADTLEHSTAGSIATNFVVNGSAKAWCQLDATNTIDVRIDTSSDTSLDFVANESSFSGFLIG